MSETDNKTIAPRFGDEPWGRGERETLEELKKMLPLVKSHVPRLGLLMAFVVLAVSACGGGASVAEQQQAQARPLPKYAQDLRPGKYHTEVFKPPLSFSVGEGWALHCPLEPDFVCLSRGGEAALFTVLNVQKIYKPSTGLALETAPAPDDLVGWFDQHPYLQTDKPEPVTVGGVKGEQFDVIAGDLPENYSGLCGTDCVYLFELGNGDRWAVEEGHKYRFTVLEDAKGETVAIDFGSPAAEFDEFLPEAEKVLKTVEWKGT